MKDKRTFESALADLQGVVLKLEDGELPLEEALNSFEAGVAHYEFCLLQLRSAEDRLHALQARLSPEQVDSGPARAADFDGLVAPEVGDEEPVCLADIHALDGNSEDLFADEALSGDSSTVVRESRNPVYRKPRKRSRATSPK